MSVVALIQRNHEKNYKFSQTKKSANPSYITHHTTITNNTINDYGVISQSHLFNNTVTIPSVYDENYEWR